MKDVWGEKRAQLMRNLDHQFQDKTLLQAAITHRSVGGMHNERLEFLGDSILSFVIASDLYRRFPKAREGELTRLRALLVRGETLAQIARELEIGAHLSLGIGEQKSGGYQRESILADALEAIMGAIYLDGGLEAARTVILNWYESRLKALVPGLSEKDPKTRLQEYLQARHLPLPEYQLKEILGDAHQPIFQVLCTVPFLKEPLLGSATTRRKAEQNAAEAALKGIHNG